MDSVIHIKVAVAVNESGNVKVFALEGHLAEIGKRYQDFRQQLIDDTQLWSLKVVKVAVPMPVQFEDMTKVEEQ